MKKPVFVQIKTTKVGPRKIVEMTGIALNKLKYERKVTMSWTPSLEGPGTVSYGHGLLGRLRALEEGHYGKIVQVSLNADYHTFSVTTFTRKSQ